MSFDVFLQRFDDVPLDPGVLTVLSPFLAGPPVEGFARIVTGDGVADVYGLGRRSQGLMFNHASGQEIWQVMIDVARVGGLVILPIGCPTCVLDEAMLALLPGELQRDTLVVKSGQDLLEAVRRA